MRKYLSGVIIVWLISCNNQTQTIAETSTKDTDSPKEEMHVMIPQSACYSTLNSKDTIRLKVERFPNVVTGTLEYKIYEKDSNKGEIDGKLNNDTLIAYYTFKSEGTQSVRQVAFLLHDSLATEGYADMEEKNDTMIFKNIAALDFSKGTKLNMTDCPQQ